MRPKAITILCATLFILGGLNLLSCVVSLFLASLGRANWGIVTTTIALGSVLGLWKMRKWGPVLYLASFAVGTVTFFIFPPNNASVIMQRPFFWILLIIIPAIYSGVVLPYWKEMK